MKKIFTFILALMATFAGAQARNVITLVEATSEDLMTIPVLTMPLTKPTFNVTTGSPAYFVVDNSNGWWHKRELEQNPDVYWDYYYKWVQVREGNFTIGYEEVGEPTVVPYHFMCQLRIQSDEYVVDENVTVMVNGEKWTTADYINRPEDGISFIWVTSPDIYPKKYEIDVIEATGPDVATFPHVGESTSQFPSYEIDKYYRWCLLYPYNMAWQKLVDGEWQDQDGEFTSGTWRLKVRFFVDMEAQDYATYTFADELKLLVNGVEWERERGGYMELDSYYSPSFTIVDEPQIGTLGTQGYWTFADGVLTVVYDGAMPTLTSKTDHADDPDVAFRYKWIDFLSEIEEVVVTGKDVEVQPYFLYYEAEGTSSGQHPDDHIKTVTLSDGVKRIGRSSFSLYELKRVNCYGVNAPILPATISSNYTAFWGSRLTANLAFLWTVPNASTDYAMINSEWAKFNHSATRLNPDDMPTPNNMADFETGNLNQVPFFSEGEYPWDITNVDAESGRYSMMSGNKGVANTSSAISAMYLYSTDGYIYFMAKCMGEGQGSGWDKCIFYIDGEQQFSYGALGDAWGSYCFPVKAGMHTFKWEYTKDSSVDPEGDGFFVDNIYFLQEGKDDDLITGIESIDHSSLRSGAGGTPLTIDHWFDLSGRRLGGKPAKAGLYINNGKKVVIK